MKTQPELIPSQLSKRSACADVAIVVLATTLLLIYVEPLVGQLIGGYPGRPIQILQQRLPSAVIAVGLVFVLLRSRGLPMSSIGINTKDVGTQVMFGILAVPLAYVALAVNFAAWYCIRWAWPDAGSWEPAREFHGWLAAEEAFGIVLALNAAGVVTEEALFRGILLTRLRRVLGAWWPAVLISSVIFGLFHLSGGLPYACNAVLLSLAFSYVYLRSGSLVSVAVTHFVFNCAQLVLLRQFLSG